MQTELQRKLKQNFSSCERQTREEFDYELNTTVKTGDDSMFDS